MSCGTRVAWLRQRGRHEDERNGKRNGTEEEIWAAPTPPAAGAVSDKAKQGVIYVIPCATDKDGGCCNPGRDSIDAAVSPAPVPYLYFVSKNDGSHYFSTDIEEHNRAVAKYQRGGR